MTLTVEEMKQNIVLSFCKNCGKQAKFTPKNSYRQCTSFFCTQCGEPTKFYRMGRPSVRHPNFIHLGKFKPQCCGHSMNSVWIYSHTRHHRIGWICAICNTIWINHTLKEKQT